MFPTEINQAPKPAPDLFSALTKWLFELDLPAARSVSKTEEERHRRGIGIRPVIDGPTVIGLIGGTIGVTAVVPARPNWKALLWPQPRRIY